MPKTSSVTVHIAHPHWSITPKPHCWKFERDHSREGGARGRPPASENDVPSLWPTLVPFDTLLASLLVQPRRILISLYSSVCGSKGITGVAGVGEDGSEGVGRFVCHVRTQPLQVAPVSWQVNLPGQKYPSLDSNEGYFCPEFTALQYVQASPLIVVGGKPYRTLHTVSMVRVAHIVKKSPSTTKWRGRCCRHPLPGRTPLKRARRHFFRVADRDRSGAVQL